MNYVLCGCLLAAVAWTVSASEATGGEASKGELLVFFGTYTRGDSEGIYVSRLNLETGKLSQPELAGKVENPSFVELHPSGKYLYAVGEVSQFDGKKAGSVTAFAVDRANGQLTQLNRRSSGGAGPCHVVVDKAGKNVLLANYSGGSCAALPLEQDGRLQEAASVMQHEGSGANPQRQSAPHAHSINLDAANRHAYVCDLGLDKVLIYDFDPAAGTLKPNDPPYAKLAPGAGPRHFTWHPDGQFAFVNNEMAMTVTAFRHDPETGKLTETHTASTLPEGREILKSDSTAEVRVHPNGRFVYVSNRGHDSIAIFEFDSSTGRLTPVGHESTRGKTPRNFNLDPSGKFLLAANQGSDNIVTFRVDANTGQLSPVGDPIPVTSPVCIRFLEPQGN